MKKYKIKKVYIVLGIIVFAIGLIILNKCRIKIIEKTMSYIEEDMYFVKYWWSEEDQIRKTDIYRYDAETNKTYKVGEVEGHFQNCELDHERKYITGLRSQYSNDSTGEKLGVVRFYLEDQTSELLLSYPEICEMFDGDFEWRRTYITDNGQKVFFSFWTDVHQYILYDLQTGEREKIEMPEEICEQIYDVCELRGDTVWYIDQESNMLACNLKTGETGNIIENVQKCQGISDDGTKLVYLKDGDDDGHKLYMYDTESGKEKCVCRTYGAGSLYNWAGSPYGTGWSRSGEYFLYERGIELIGSADEAIKVYNVRTGRSKAIHRERFSNVYIEFVINGD